MITNQNILRKSNSNLPTNRVKPNRNILMVSFTFICSVLVLCSCNSIEIDELSFNNSRNGCANFLLYTIEDQQNVSLSIRGNRDILNLSTTAQQIDLPSNELIITINEFDGEIGNFYCDDVDGDEGNITNEYSPISGTAEILIAQDSIQVNEWELIYEITVRLKDITFDINGEVKTFEQLNFNNVVVGWLPG